MINPLLINWNTKRLILQYCKEKEIIMLDLNIWIDNAKKLGITDIHIRTGKELIGRKEGKIEKIGNGQVFSQNNIIEMIEQSKLNLSVEDMAKIKKAEFTSIDTSCKFCNARVNVFKDINGIGLAIRILSEDIPSMDALRLPPTVKNFVTYESGLVIISGPTGSGKTTTLASLLNEISKHQQKHIITIEDPVEYKIPSVSAVSLVTQRNVGIDCDSFASGLRDALRQDPDVILVGEMRDAETITTAMQAAETGHLVFSTLHASNVVEAVDRFSQYFPAERNSEIRLQLANCLQGIVAQKLLPGADKINRVAAFEVMLATDAIRAVIRSGKTYQLRDYMHRDAGMNSMDECIQGLCNKHLI